VAWALLTALNALATAGLGIPPLPLGSGKFGTPCERMQEEYATRPDEPDLPPPEEWALVVLVAALGADGLVPQAATAPPTARIPTPITAARCNRGRRLSFKAVAREMSFSGVAVRIAPPESRRWGRWWPGSTRLPADDRLTSWLRRAREKMFM
jgi:hypothetical protein